jgi:hypothetical protein
MNNRALTPESISLTQIADGYQLCARCGEVLVEGEGAFAAPRLSSWYIYTHQTSPNCRPKAVRGWKAVLHTEAVWSTKNVETAREAEPCFTAGSRRSCVCLLDDKHIQAELALVGYQPSAEAVAKRDDLRAMDSHTLNRRESSDRAKIVEDALIEAIDQCILDQNLDALLECVWSCRRKSYASVKAAPHPDTSPSSANSRESIVELAVCDEMNLFAAKT